VTLPAQRRLIPRHPHPQNSKGETLLLWRLVGSLERKEVIGMNQPKDDGSVIDARWTKLVLDDCGLALSQLKQNPTGQDWRIKWVGMLA
jgi:hypothetical protein